MQETFEINRSRQPMYVQIAAILSIGILLLVFSASLSRTFDNAVSADFSALTQLTRLTILFLVIGSVLTVRARIKRVSYSATRESIIIRKKMFGTSNKKYYSISQVTSVELNQSYMGSVLGYGNIEIIMDKLGKTENIVLEGIEDPEDTLRKLQNFVNHIRR